MLFNGAYFLLAVMVEADESSRLRMAKQPTVLAGCEIQGENTASAKEIQQTNEQRTYIVLAQKF